MNTANPNVSRIAGLLHQARNVSCTSNLSLELSAAIKGATPYEMAMALLEFSHDLLRASKQVLTIQRDAALAEQILNERDATGGLLQ